MKTVILWGVLAKLAASMLLVGAAVATVCTTFDLSGPWVFVGASLFGVLGAEIAMRLFGLPFRIDFE